MCYEVCSKHKTFKLSPVTDTEYVAILLHRVQSGLDGLGVSVLISEEEKEAEELELEIKCI
jgi:hypothetical protein